MITPLGDLVKISPGPSIRARLDYEAGGDVFMVQQGDIRRDGLSRDLQRIIYPVSERHVLMSGDVLLRSKGNPMIAAVFTAAPIADLLTICAGSVIRLRPDSPALDPEYLVWFLNSDNGQAQMEQMKTGTNIPSLSPKRIGDLMIALPPIEVQRSIVELAELARRQEECARLYREKVESLLQAIFIPPELRRRPKPFGPSDNDDDDYES